MAIKGQKFSLDLDADNFKFDLVDDASAEVSQPFDVVGEIQEREPTDPPPAPRLKSKSGFPDHRTRKSGSLFKQRQRDSSTPTSSALPQKRAPWEPSDQAIANRIGEKYDVSREPKEKAQISEENERKIANMSSKEIEAARAEILASMSPALVQRMLRKANIEEDQQGQDWDAPVAAGKGSTQTVPGARSTMPRQQGVLDKALDMEQSPEERDTANLAGAIHFPRPPRDSASFVPLDPNSDTFLHDLKSHYFPDTPHDPNTLVWLQDPTAEEIKTSSYAADKTGYAPSVIRFDFAGRLVPPSESETVPVARGLHHHGDAPNSAGYTIPELAMLCRSTLPNQRCMSYQTLGRILYRLGRGDFGPKGTELNEGLWTCIEKERPVEVMMAEANRIGGHISAKTYATEALWLWRRAGHGDRGVLKPSASIPR